MTGSLQSERHPDHEDALLKHKFEILFREHFTGLCYFARKYTGDLDSAKEIVHNVFLRIWENRSDFEWEKPAKSYLFTSVYNRSLNHIRDNRKLIREEDFQTLHLIADESAYSENLKTAELENRIKQTLQRLPEKCRQVFELSRFEQKKYSEIAMQLNISVKTVETQMSKALHVLREELKDYLTILILMLIKNMQNW
ncbi:MAG: RNA polymerase sigma-70 factor [Bacteroidales bacterium]|nr:RNA polymerase sigma-70 factor [Bacteroidales bacterium]